MESYTRAVANKNIKINVIIFLHSERDYLQAGAGITIVVAREFSSSALLD
jgi:hypothetical protein